MRKALFTCVPSMRSSSEIRMTPMSHANSTSRLEAMTRKFWPEVFVMMPMMSAKVTVVAAISTADCLRRNSGVFSRLGSR